MEILFKTGPSTSLNNTITLSYGSLVMIIDNIHASLYLYSLVRRTLAFKLNDLCSTYSGHLAPIKNIGCAATFVELV